MTPATFSRREAAAYTGISLRQFGKLLGDTQACIPRIRIGRTVRIPKAGLNDWLTSQTKAR